jgi:uncharacterized protein
VDYRLTVSGTAGNRPMFSWGIIALGAMGGVLGHLSGFPAGALLGSVMTVGTVGLVRDAEANVPKPMRVSARILIGTVIGSIMTLELLASLGGKAVWAVAFTVVMIAAGLLCAVVLSRLGRVDRKTAIIACSPGGLSEMTALADELGARSDLVLAVHLFRKFAALGIAMLVIAALQVR